MGLARCFLRQEGTRREPCGSGFLTRRRSRGAAPRSNGGHGTRPRICVGPDQISDHSRRMNCVLTVLVWYKCEESM